MNTQTGQVRNLIGHLRLGSDDALWMETETGNEVVRFRSPAQEEQTPINVRIALSVDEDNVVTGNPWYEVLA